MHIFSARNGPKECVRNRICCRRNDLFNHNRIAPDTNSYNYFITMKKTSIDLYKGTEVISEADLNS